MKKQLIGVVLAVLLLVSLTACGKRSEAQIKSDFIDQDAYITPYNMTVDLKSQEEKPQGIRIL